MNNQEEKKEISEIKEMLKNIQKDLEKVNEKLDSKDEEE